MVENPSGQETAMQESGEPDKGFMFEVSELERKREACE